jgi:DNA-binding transcriptional LysR family regulator
MKKLLRRFLILNLGISIVLDVTSVPAIAVARPAAVRADGEPEIWSTVYPVWKHRFGIPDTCTRIRAHLAELAAQGTQNKLVGSRLGRLCSRYRVADGDKFFVRIIG